MVGRLGFALHLTLEVRLQPLEGNHDHCNIVEGLLVEGQLHDVFDCFSAELVQGVEAAFISPEGVPDHFDHFGIGQFVVYAVTWIAVTIQPRMMKSSYSVTLTCMT